MDVTLQAWYYRALIIGENYMEAESNFCCKGGRKDKPRKVLEWKNQTEFFKVIYKIFFKAHSKCVFLSKKNEWVFNENGNST